MTKLDTQQANREQCRKLLEAAKPFWNCHARLGLKATYKKASYSEDRANSWSTTAGRQQLVAYANAPLYPEETTQNSAEPSFYQLRKAVKAVKVAPCEGKGVTLQLEESPEPPKAKKLPGNEPKTQKVNKPVQNVFPAGPRQPPVCYFHQQGACRYGPSGWNWLGRCKFRHL